MQKLAATVGVAVAVAAWGAKAIISPTYHGATAPAPVGGPDASLTLAWDTGNVLSGAGWYTGANAWTAVDFNISTLSSYNDVTAGMILYYPNWPNNICEGNRMAVYAFAGGAPGSILWGPTFVRGATTGSWQTFSIGWSLGATTFFMLAFNQYYDYPNCDPVINLSSAGSYSHSWYYYQGWLPIVGLGYGNYPLMIRVVVSDNVGIAPSSVGRVKALYY